MPARRRGQRASARAHFAFAPRGAVQLAFSINSDVPDMGLRKGVIEPVPAPAQKPNSSAYALRPSGVTQVRVIEAPGVTHIKYRVIR